MAESEKMKTEYEKKQDLGYKVLSYFRLTGSLGKTREEFGMSYIEIIDAVLHVARDENLKSELLRRRKEFEEVAEEIRRKRESLGEKLPELKRINDYIKSQSSKPGYIV